MLPDIPRSKDNKAMKFVQLIEYEVYFSSEIMRRLSWRN